MMQNRLELAVDIFSRATDSEPENSDFYVLLGNALKQQKRIAAAIAQYIIALKLNPRSHQSSNNLGNIYSQDKEWRLAFCYYYHSYLVLPNSSTSNNIAVVLKKMGLKGPSRKMNWEEYFLKEHSAREMIDFRELALCDGKKLEVLIVSVSYTHLTLPTILLV